MVLAKLEMNNSSVSWKRFVSNSNTRHLQFLDMGCLCAKNLEKDSVSNEEKTKRTYSWDEKRKLGSNSKNFIIEDLDNQEEIRIPGSIDGQQFIIQNCKDATIYVLDYMNTITIDDCVNCKLILGPISGSAFIRNCTSCTCILACGQFRMRDCIKINVFLSCATQPIIEASRGINFGTYQLRYNGIEGHFQKANLTLVNGQSKDVYDFTPVDYQENWNYLYHDNVTLFVPGPKLNMIKCELVKYGHYWWNSERSLSPLNSYSMIKYK